MDLRFFVAHFHFMEKERSYYERIGFRLIEKLIAT